MRRRGGRIGPLQTVSTTSASGFWDLTTQQQQKGANLFPGPSVIGDGLVLHLDAANPSSYSGSGSTWVDLSGNGLNATFTNGTPTYSSSNGGRFEFGANNVYAQVATSALFNVGTGDFGIEVWVQFPTQVNQYGHLFGLPDQAGSRIFKTDADANSTLYFFDGSSSYLYQVSNYTVPAGSWRQIVFTRRSGTVFGYTNGVSRGSQAATSLSLTSTSVRIRPSITVEYKTTYFSKALFYNVGLTDAQVSHNYQRFQERFP